MSAPAATRRALGLVLLVVLALAPALRAHTPADDATRARDAVDTVLESMRRGVDSEIRASLHDLAAHDHPSVVDLVLRLFDHEAPVWRPKLRSVLASFTSTASTERLLGEGLGHRDEVVRAQTLLALGQGRPRDVDWITPAEAALDDPIASVRAAAVWALGRSRAAGRTGRILELAADDSERVRKEVPEALARLVGTRSLPLLRSLAGDPRWRVRLAVARALGVIKTPEAVEQLVDMLDVEAGRVREDVLLELRRMTGKNFGLDAGAWRRWLEIAPDDYLAAADLSVLGPAPTMVSTVKYYGLSTLSKRFVFITDLSGSMGTRDVARYSDSGGAARTRLDITTNELERLIEGLDPSHAFNLLTFTDDVDRWKRDLVRAEPNARKQAIREVLRYRADGATNVHAALVDVLDMAERALDAHAEVDDPDTVFLLSDGAPSAGRIRDVDLLLDMVLERNRDLELRFHCIALTRDPISRDFLARLAAMTGGQYVNPLE